MRTIAVLNQKGGVGKTTTVVNTAAALASMGATVLAIDLDPQAHLTIHLGLEPQRTITGSYKVLTRSAQLEQEILMTRLNLWVLPANINLVGAETELVSVVGRETILREALERAGSVFDYCFIDCPPSLGLLTLNALAAADEVLIPLQPHFLALQGFGKLLQTVELVNRRINPALRVEGVLLCMFDTTASLPAEVRADIERFLDQARGTNCAWADARILPTFIRRNIKLAEAPSYGKTIFEYERNCNGAEDYRKVAEFIRSRSGAARQRHPAGAAPQPIREVGPVPRPVEGTRPAAPAGMPRPPATDKAAPLVTAGPVATPGQQQAAVRPHRQQLRVPTPGRPVPPGAAAPQQHAHNPGLSPARQPRTAAPKPPPGPQPQQTGQPPGRAVPAGETPLPPPGTQPPQRSDLRPAAPAVSRPQAPGAGGQTAPRRAPIPPRLTTNYQYRPRPPAPNALTAGPAARPAEPSQNRPAPMPIKQVPQPAPKKPEPVRRAENRPDAEPVGGND